MYNTACHIQVCADVAISVACVYTSTYIPLVWPNKNYQKNVFIPKYRIQLTKSHRLDIITICEWRKKNTLISCHYILDLTYSA